MKMLKKCLFCGFIMGLFVFAPMAQAEFKIAKILTGYESSCGLSSDGELKCWGSNQNFELGTGDNYDYGFYPGSMGAALPVANLGTNFKVADMCQGWGFSCAASVEGKVKCWGNNFSGSLGHGDFEGPTTEFGELLAYTDLGTDFRAKSLTCGFISVCALSAEGKAKCWGANSWGELGLGDTDDRGGRPGQMGDKLSFIQTQKPIRAIEAGINYFCYQFDDGIRCVGKGDRGVLGQQNKDSLGHTPATANLDHISPIALEAPGVAIKIRKLTSGGSHSCVLYEKDNKDHVKCWGDNFRGALGVGNTRESYGDTPQSMGEYLPEVNVGLDKIVDIRAHQGHTCVLSAQGKLKCWGENFNGQLGLGDQNSRGQLPSQMGSNLPEVDLGLPVKSLNGGSFSSHSCATLINNQVKCWGSNYRGQLGYEDGISRGGKLEDMGGNLPFLSLN